MDSLLLARRLAARGLVVIPVPRPGPDRDGKTPVLAWKRYQTVRPTAEDLVRWFAQQSKNLAILTGSLSGIVVVDVDGDAGRAWANAVLPVTPWMVTTSKGVHYYFQHPGEDVVVANRVRLPGDDGRLPVDIRGDGGYVLAAGSLHASGVRYREIGDWTQPRDTLPRFDPSWLPGPLERQAVTNQEPPRHLNAAVDVRLIRARKYLAAIPQPVIGHGSDLATFVAACHLVRGFALSPSDAEELLWSWAGGRDGWDREWISQKVQSAMTHGKEVMGALL